MANKKIDIDYSKLQSEIQSLDQLAGNTTVKDKIAEINRTINKLII